MSAVRYNTQMPFLHHSKWNHPCMQLSPAVFNSTDCKLSVLSPLEPISIFSFHHVFVPYTSNQHESLGRNLVVPESLQYNVPCLRLGTALRDLNLRLCCASNIKIIIVTAKSPEMSPPFQKQCVKTGIGVILYMMY